MKRDNAAYQENIVVSGGMVTDGRVLNTVEPYDVFFNEFSPMPNMIKGKYGLVVCFLFLEQTTL